jgi:hypothetical protein
LERGLKNATKSGQNFVGWVVGFYRLNYDLSSSS